MSQPGSTPVLEAISDEHPSLENELRDLTVLAGAIGMPPEQYRAGCEQIKARWRAKGSET